MRVDKQALIRFRDFLRGYFDCARSIRRIWEEPIQVIKRRGSGKQCDPRQRVKMGRAAVWQAGEDTASGSGVYNYAADKRR